jgi:glucose-6-phosphate 1-dehydrogenase
MSMLESDAFVFFGATGDLAYKKIFPALYAMVRSSGLGIPIIGMARAGWTLDKLKQRARESVEHAGDFEAACFEKFSAQLRYVNGDYSDPATYTKLKQALGLATRPIHYLAIPPSMFASVVQGLAKSGCAENARVIVEKPFGRDLTRCLPKPPSFASIIIWARRRCKIFCISASPTLFSIRFGIATTSRTYKLRWPRSSG